jgi:hypothetical protein
MAAPHFPTLSYNQHYLMKKIFNIQQLSSFSQKFFLGYSPFEEKCKVVLELKYPLLLSDLKKKKL